MKKAILTIAAIMVCFSAIAKKPKKEPVYNEQGQIIKTGLNYGPLPAVAFDADKGFQLGAILQIFDYGDGSTYPNYFNRTYFEASWFTKGSMLFQFQHDNKMLIPGVRWSSSIVYNIDKAFDFYGFNGYQSFYDFDRMAFKNDSKAIKKGLETPDPDFKYRFNPYYRFNKTYLYAKSDFTGKITDHLSWEAGYHFRWYNQSPIDRVSINKNKHWYDTYPSGPETFANVKETDKRGDTDVRPEAPTLFEQFQQWGIIGDKEVYDKKGKYNMFDSGVRLGLMYDTRDKEGAPTRGIWAEGHVILAPWWLGSSNSSYRYGLSFRNYAPIVKNDVLTFAYRIAYEGTFGSVKGSQNPYYTIPFYTVQGNETDRDGNGGYRTTRGILRTRVVGLDQALWNAELRYKFVEFKLWKQNIAFSLTAFTDGAWVTRPYDMTFGNHSDNKDFDAASFTAYKLFMQGRYNEMSSEVQNKNYKTVDCGSYGEVHTLKEIPHTTFGLGLRFIMNTNFIVAFEYGMPTSRFYKKTSPYCKQDGNGAFYINLGYLF
ncbi:MAG: outer membrane protein assembly factor [Bacteroidales bacterium]|nr:outer membrane protein assembly factor [Bacteroidales bacterium]